MTRQLSAEPVRSREQTLVVVLIGITTVAAIISSLGAPLIPSVARMLSVPVGDAQWSLTAALLAGAVSAPILGRLGDGPHRRETIIISLALVFLGSLIAGFADSLPVLIIGRAFQGIALGLAPITMAAARDNLPHERATSVIAILSVAGAAGVGAGYPISGFIAENFNVHAAFLFGALIAALALVAAVAVIPSSRGSGQIRMDLSGAFLAAAGLITLLLAIEDGASWGWLSPAILGLFATSAVIFVVWIRQQLSRTTPFVDIRQLRHRAVRTADLAAIMLGMAMYMFLTVVTQFVQTPPSEGYGFGSSTFVAGLCLVPFSVTSLTASRTTRAITRRVSVNNVLIGGSLSIAAAGTLFALLHGALWEAFAMMAIMGVGFGYTFAAIPGMIAVAVPKRDTGSAMGLYQVIRYIGFSIGSALTASIVASHTAIGAHHPSEQGYVTALWVGAVICALSAVASATLGRGEQPTSDPISDVERDRLMLEDAELAAAGLIGIEHEPEE